MANIELRDNLEYKYSINIHEMHYNKPFGRHDKHSGALVLIVYFGFSSGNSQYDIVYFA